MAVNKVVINRNGVEDVLVDLTGDNVNPDALVVGHTTHDQTGEVIEGANPYVKAETDATVNTQAGLITQLKDAIAENVGKTTAEVETQAGLITQLKDAIAENVGKTTAEVETQTDLIQQIKGAINENVGKTTAEVETQADLIQQIKTALEGKAGGAADPVIEPLEVTENGTYAAPEGVDGYSPVVVSVPVPEGYIVPSGILEITKNGEYDVTEYAEVNVEVPTSDGYAIKSGTTTSQTINTGLSDVEQFFMYKETQTGTGLIHLHYTKSATSRMYASAWSTNTWGSKTITNGTGGVTVSGGTVTISATQAAQGALTSNVTYKWIAVGTE